MLRGNGLAVRYLLRGENLEQSRWCDPSENRISNKFPFKCPQRFWYNYDKKLFLDLIKTGTGICAHSWVLRYPCGSIVRCSFLQTDDRCDCLVHSPVSLLLKLRVFAWKQLRHHRNLLLVFDTSIIIMVIIIEIDNMINKGMSARDRTHVHVHACSCQFISKSVPILWGTGTGTMVSPNISIAIIDIDMVPYLHDDNSIDTSPTGSFTLERPNCIATFPTGSFTWERPMFV